MNNTTADKTNTTQQEQTQNSSYRRILAAHDFSGFGHTSLMAAIAIFYRYGIRVAALPTALLTANTDHAGYQMHSLDDVMRDFLNHWQKLQLRLDGIYTGFLGAPSQVDLLIWAIENLAPPGIPILIDPVLGDHGILYGCYDDAMVQAMRRLVQKATLITPNTTEAALLLGEEPVDDPRRDWQKMAWELSQLGPSGVAISSIPSTDPKLRYCGVADGNSQSWDLIPYPSDGNPHPGSGDCFASLIMAGIVKGGSLVDSVQRATRLISFAIDMDGGLREDWREGIQLDRLLSLNLGSLR
ncbi:MAG: pyridoxine kinase [Candidatus Cloacimonetes bacterium]|nr:bifunctional hydroxymethylpyrimidine kinase/phosphomethylpyrimidine kinase [Candidatus Cloacimonadota bacterium]NLO11187.1 pyridoxine kinase [Candidatus Cloacimonadota bacterium]